MVKMTTRSGSGNAPDPDSSEQIESRPPAKPKDSTPEPSDRHSGVLGSEPIIIKKYNTLDNRQNCDSGVQAINEASAHPERINCEPGTTIANNEASSYPQNSHDFYTASVDKSHSLLYPRNAAESVQASPHLSFRQDDIENLSQTDLELRIATIKQNRRTNALRNELRALMTESLSDNSNVYNLENGARCFETEQDRLRRKIVENKKLFRQLRHISEPRAELELFESRCKSFHIDSDREKLELLIHIWPRNDIIDFRETNSESQFNYFNLKTYLIGKKSRLPHILRFKQSTLGQASFQSDKCLAEKLSKADKESTIKYFMSAICPIELKKKVEEAFTLKLDDFLVKIEQIYSGPHSEILEKAQEFRYEQQSRNFHKKKQNNNKNTHVQQSSRRPYRHNQSNQVDCDQQNGYNNQNAQYDSNVNYQNVANNNMGFGNVQQNPTHYQNVMPPNNQVFNQNPVQVNNRYNNSGYTNGPSNLQGQGPPFNQGFHNQGPPFNNQTNLPSQGHPPNNQNFHNRQGSFNQKNGHPSSRQ